MATGPGTPGKGSGALLELHTAVGSGEGGMGVTAASPTTSCQRDPSCFREQGAEITPTASMVKRKGKMTGASCVIFMLTLPL